MLSVQVYSPAARTGPRGMLADEDGENSADEDRAGSPGLNSVHHARIMSEHVALHPCIPVEWVQVLQHLIYAVATFVSKAGRQEMRMGHLYNSCTYYVSLSIPACFMLMNIYPSENSLGWKATWTPCRFTCSIWYPSSPIYHNPQALDMTV